MISNECLNVVSRYPSSTNRFGDFAFAFFKCDKEQFISRNIL